MKFVLLVEGRTERDAAAVFLNDGWTSSFANR
jgi:hypothetical protein